MHRWLLAVVTLLGYAQLPSLDSGDRLRASGCGAPIPRPSGHERRRMRRLSTPCLWSARRVVRVLTILIEDILQQKKQRNYGKLRF